MQELDLYSDDKYKIKDNKFNISVKTNKPMNQRIERKSKK